jgi:hypothetical protein
VTQDPARNDDHDQTCDLGNKPMTTTVGTRILQFSALGCAFTISTCLVIREQLRANPQEPATTSPVVQVGVTAGTPENVALHSARGAADTSLAADANPVYILGSKSMALPDGYLVDDNGRLLPASDSALSPDEFLFSSKSATIEIIEGETAQGDIYLPSSKWGSIYLNEPEEFSELPPQTRPSAQTDQFLLSSSKSFVMGDPFGGGVDVLTDEPEHRVPVASYYGDGQYILHGRHTLVGANVGRNAGAVIDDPAGAIDPTLLFSSKSGVLSPYIKRKGDLLRVPAVVPEELAAADAEVSPPVNTWRPSAGMEFQLISNKEIETKDRELEELRQRIADLEAKLAAQQDD